MHHISEFSVGMFVQNNDHYLKSTGPEGGMPFIGTVKGMTVNAFGEPILVLHMITRRFTDHTSMLYLGYTPVDNTHVDEMVDVFYECTRPMHPSNVTIMLPSRIPGTILKETE